MRRHRHRFTLALTLLLFLGWAPLLAQTPESPNAAPVADRAEAQVQTPSGYGALLFQMVIVVISVCLLAYLVLRFGVKRFFASDGASSGPMEVLARLPVEPRRSVLVVRVGGQHLIIGSSEAGLERIGVVPPEEISLFTAAPRRAFADVFKKSEGSREPELVEKVTDSATTE